MVVFARLLRSGACLKKWMATTTAQAILVFFTPCSQALLKLKEPSDFLAGIEKEGDSEFMATHWLAQMSFTHFVSSGPYPFVSKAAKAHG